MMAAGLRVGPIQLRSREWAIPRRHAGGSSGPAEGALRPPFAFELAALGEALEGNNEDTAGAHIHAPPWARRRPEAAPHREAPKTAPTPSQISAQRPAGEANNRDKGELRAVPAPAIDAQTVQAAHRRMEVSEITLRGDQREIIGSGVALCRRQLAAALGRHPPGVPSPFDELAPSDGFDAVGRGVEIDAVAGLKYFVADFRQPMARSRCREAKEPPTVSAAPPVRPGPCLALRCTGGQRYGGAAGADATGGAELRLSDIGLPRGFGLLRPRPRSARAPGAENRHETAGLFARVAAP